MPMSMPTNLCCGRSLQKGAKLVAYSDIGVEIAGILIQIFVMMAPHSKTLSKIIKDMGITYNVTTGCHIPDDYGEDQECSELTEIITVTLSSGSVLVHAIQLILSLVLIKGVNQRDDKQSALWTVLTAILTVLQTGLITGQMVVTSQKNDIILTYTVPNVMYKLYSLGIVKSFVTEVRRYESLGGSTNDESHDENKDQ